MSLLKCRPPPFLTKFISSAVNFIDLSIFRLISTKEKVYLRDSLMRTWLGFCGNEASVCWTWFWGFWLFWSWGPRCCGILDDWFAVLKIFTPPVWGPDPCCTFPDWPVDTIFVPGCDSTELPGLPWPPLLMEGLEPCEGTEPPLLLVKMLLGGWLFAGTPCRCWVHKFVDGIDELDVFPCCDWLLLLKILTEGWPEELELGKRLFWLGYATLCRIAEARTGWLVCIKYTLYKSNKSLEWNCAKLYILSNTFTMLDSVNIYILLQIKIYFNK